MVTLGTGPLDVLMVAVALALLFRMRRARPPLWELVVIAGLAILTIKAGRDGVWLLFFLAPLAAHSSRAVRREWNGLLPIAAVAALAMLVLGLARTPTRATVGPALVARAITLAHGTPVLAEAIAAEQLALAGGRIWVGDPLDAFPRRIQGLYLDWLAGDPDGRAVLANPRIEVVLVSPGSAALTLTAADSAFIRVAGDKAAVLFVRRAPRGSAPPPKCHESKIRWQPRGRLDAAGTTRRAQVLQYLLAQRAAPATPSLLARLLTNFRLVTPPLRGGGAGATS